MIWKITKKIKCVDLNENSRVKCKLIDTFEGCLRRRGDKASYVF